VVGDLAKNIKWMTKLSKKQIAALVALLGVGTVSVVASPVVTPAVMTATVGITGAEIAQIIFASSLGIALICSVFNGYDVEASIDGNVKLTKK
jgi:hypothetical protein